MDKVQRFFNPNEPAPEPEGGVMSEISGLSWETRLKAFGICLLVAVLLGIGAAIIYFLGDNITGFAILYTVAVIFALASTIFLMGPMNQLKRMFDPTRLIATIVFILSIIMTLISALVFKIPILVLIFVIVQFLALGWYTISYIPFARQAITTCCRGILVEMSSAGIKKIPLISLPYLKKRLRRITALGFRNLTVNQSNFSIHFTLHRNEKTVAFYTSESIANKRSPEWPYLQFPKNVQLLHEFIIRVWVTSSNTSRLFLEYDVCLDDSLVPDEQKEDFQQTNNSFWFEMFGHRYSDSEPPLDTKKHIRIMIPETKTNRKTWTKSYNSSSIQRMINTMESTRIDNRSSMECLDQLQTFYNAHKDYILKRKERELRKVRIEHMKQHLLIKVSSYERRLSSNQYRQKIINERKAKLDQNLFQLLNQRQELNQLTNQLIQSKYLLHDLTHLTFFRQRDMISEIYRYVYPITAESKTEFSIGNIRLPPAEDKSYLLSLTREREYEIEAALGFCAHIVLIISQIFQLPLRFPIDYYGVSFIRIYDYSQQKPDYPLSPSYDSRSFEYGLYLLNRDIGQILAHCRASNRHPDCRKTLENLREIMEQCLIYVNQKPQVQLFLFNQQMIESTSSTNSSTDRPNLQTKRNSTASSIFSSSRSTVSSTIEMNDHDTHDVDQFPTLNTIAPRLTMQFSQQ